MRVCWFIAALGGVLIGCSSAPPAAESARGSAPRAVSEQHARGPSSYYGKSHAVVIGIDEYTALPRLGYGVNDARAVAQALESRGFEVTRLLGAQATKPNIERVLFKTLPAALEKNDRVLVFFAGHAVSKYDVGYLMPMAASTDDAAYAGVKMTELQGVFADRDMYPAKHVLFVANACFANLALGSRGAGLDRETQSYVRHIVSQSVRVAFSAGRDGEPVGEQGGRGIFTRLFIEGIDGAADHNGDGIVTTAELWPFLSKQVAEASQHRQTPQYQRLGRGEFVFRAPEAKAPAVSALRGLGLEVAVSSKSAGPLEVTAR